MDFMILGCKSFEELANEIKSRMPAKENSLEIERKWLIDYSLINYLSTKMNLEFSAKEVFAAYLSIEPEIRFRTMRDLKSYDISSYLSYKTNGELIREEYDIEISKDDVKEIANYIQDNEEINKCDKTNWKYLFKHYYKFNYGNGIEIEISVVDTDEDFTYMEIEFPDADSANSFQLPEDIATYVKSEVTSDPYYKMKNYWARTRLNKINKSGN